MSVRRAARRDASTPPAALQALLDLDLLRIVQALADRARYRYVQPTVLRVSNGWTIVSPNCSRSVDPDGGEIAIALFEPERVPGQWRLYRRDHAQSRWVLEGAALTLDQAVQQVCADAVGVFWP